MAGGPCSCEDILWMEELLHQLVRCLYPLVVPLFTMVPFQYLPTGAGVLPSALSNDKDTKSIQR